MNFITKIFKGDTDEEVHRQFEKFSRGEFRNRALIEAKSSKGKYKIKTSSEFANELVKEVAKKLGKEKTNIKGIIISTKDLSGVLNFKDKKQYQGIKKYIINEEKSGEEILKLLEDFPKIFFALSFKDEKSKTELKIKPKAPKSKKPKNKDQLAKADFCTLRTTDKKLLESFIFENPDFKDAKVEHTFIINDLILPKGEKDFLKIREIAKRKGKIIRKSIIDGKEKISEKEFTA